MRRSLARLLAVFALFAAVDLALFQAGLVEPPRRDDVVFEQERMYFDSDLDWFVHSLSFNRTRLLATGDFILFRPGTMAVIALDDILFRSNPVAAGITATMMHAAAATALFHACALMTGTATAALLALLFLVQYAGMEIAIWHHISPYLLGLAAFGAGITSFARARAENRRPWAAAAFFLAGMLFHEGVTMACAALAMLLFAIRRIPRRELGIALVAPVLAYSVMNLADFLWYKSRFLDMGRGGAEPSIPFSLARIAAESASFLSAAATSFLLPFRVDLTLEYDVSLGWMFWTHLDPIDYAAGAVAASLVVIAFLVSFRRLAKDDVDAGIAGISFCTLSVALAAYVIIGRIVPRGIEYLNHATYYYAIISFGMCGVVAAVAGRPRGRLPRLCIAAGITVLAASNAVSAYRTLDEIEPHISRYFNVAGRVASIFRVDRRFCFAGADSRYFDAVNFLVQMHNFITTPDIYCRTDDARTPLYLTIDENRQLLFSEISVDKRSRPRLKPVRMEYDDTEYELTGGRMTHRAGRGGSQTLKFVISEPSFKGCDFRFTVEPVKRFMGIFDFVSPDSMNGFIITDGMFMPSYLPRKSIIDVIPRPVLGGRMDISVVFNGYEAYVFDGRFFLGSIPRKRGAMGGIGFTVIEGGEGQSFDNFLVADRCDEDAVLATTARYVLGPADVVSPMSYTVPYR